LDDKILDQIIEKSVMDILLNQEYVTKLISDQVEREVKQILSDRMRSCLNKKEDMFDEIVFDFFEKNKEGLIKRCSSDFLKSVANYLRFSE